MRAVQCAEDRPHLLDAHHDRDPSGSPRANAGLDSLELSTHHGAVQEEERASSLALGRLADMSPNREMSQEVDDLCRVHLLGVSPAVGIGGSLAGHSGGVPARSPPADVGCCRAC